MIKRNRLVILLAAVVAMLGLAVPALTVEPAYIYAMHDSGGEIHMAQKGTKGYIVFTESIGCSPTDYSGKDFSYWYNNGYGVIVRLNNGYDGAGTLPYESQYANFAQRCKNYVAASSGVDYWIIGNETNLPREWPGNVDGDDETGEPITVARYISCYNQCYTKMKEANANAKICPAPVGTWAPPYDGTCDPFPDRGVPGFMDYWVQCLNGIGASKISALIIHTYTHACDPSQIISEAKMGEPYGDIYKDFRVYKNFMWNVPTGMTSLPVYCTESNMGHSCMDENNYTWLNQNIGWVRDAYAEINRWNLTNTQKIRSLALFRWQDTDENQSGDTHNSGIENRSAVIDDWRMAMDNGYQWNVAVQKGTISGTVKNTNNVAISGVSISTTGGYYATTNSSGAYTISNVAIGTYNVTAAKAGYDQQTQSGKTVTNNATTTANFTLVATSDVVQNGSFENGFSVGVGSNWTKFNTSGYSPTFEDGTDYKYDGSHSQKITMPQPSGNDYIGGVYQQVSTNASTQYTLTAYTRGQMAEAYSGEHLICRLGYDLTGGTNPGSGNVVWQEFDATKNTWVSRTMTFTASGSTVTIFLQGKRKWPSGGTGYVWFDKVTCTGPSAQTYGTIAGNVKDGSGANLSGATVSTTAGSYSTTTDSSGNYTLSNVATGTYDVVASKSGYSSHTQTGKTVSQNQTTTVNFTVTAIDMYDGTPSGTNAALSATTVQTDSNYSSSYEGDKAKDGIVSAASKWCSTGSVSTHWISYDLGSTKTVTGFVVRHAGAAGEYTTYNLKNFKFQSASSLSGPWTDECVVDNTAQASVTSRTYYTPRSLRYVRLYITNCGVDNYARLPEFEVYASSSTGTLSGNVKDQAGANVSGATVSTTSGSYTTTTDSSGNYTLTNVAPATYSVVASKTGYNSQTQTGKTVNAGATTTVNFTITRQTGAIAGNVKNSSGANLSGATVSTTIGGYTTTTDSSGNYTLSNVATGTYSVVASKSGYSAQTQTGKTVNYNQTTTCNFTLSTVSIQNGSFENGFTNNVGNNWTSFVSTSYSPTFADGTDYKYDGSHSQKITMPQPSAADKYAGIYQTVSTSSGSSYALTVYERASMSESYAGEHLVCRVGIDLTGGTSFTSGNVTWQEINATKGSWQSLTRNFTATGSNTTIFLQAWRKWASGGTGYVWFDKVTLTAQ